jgi:hypothetical protein
MRRITMKSGYHRIQKYRSEKNRSMCDSIFIYFFHNSEIDYYLKHIPPHGVWAETQQG